MIDGNLMDPATQRSVSARPAPSLGCMVRTAICRRRSAARRGFTLVETLIVIGILSVLVGILVPALRSARSQMKTLICKSNLKTVALKFHLFADGLNEGGAGSRRSSDGKQFSIDEFQSYIYRTGDYWSVADRTSIEVSPGEELMMCPAGPTRLVKHSGKSFGPESIQPVENVSIAMNGRFYRAVTIDPVTGKPVLASTTATRVTPDVLNHPFAPLAFDVDGVQAKEKGISPFYSAPPGRLRDDPYGAGELWVPARRHRGSTNVAFVGGHVLSSLRPSREPWDWDYAGQVRR